jgi:hypothetical protein
MQKSTKNQQFRVPFFLLIAFHLWFVQLGFLAREVDVELVFGGLWEDVGASFSVASCSTIAKCTCESTFKWTFGLGS